MHDRSKLGQDNGKSQQQIGERTSVHSYLDASLPLFLHHSVSRNTWKKLAPQPGWYRHGMSADRTAKPLLYKQYLLKRECIDEKSDAGRRQKMRSVCRSMAEKWGVCRYVRIFLLMDEPTYTVKRQTKTYVTRYVGMSLFSLPMDDA